MKKISTNTKEIIFGLITGIIFWELWVIILTDISLLWGAFWLVLLFVVMWVGPIIGHKLFPGLMAKIYDDQKDDW